MTEFLWKIQKRKVTVVVVCIWMKFEGGGGDDEFIFLLDWYLPPVTSDDIVSVANRIVLYTWNVAKIMYILYQNINICMI